MIDRYHPPDDSHSIYVSISPSIHPSIYPFLSIYRSIHLPIHPSIYPSIYIHPNLSISISILLSIYPSICPSIHLFIHLSIYPSIHPSIYPSIHLFIHPGARRGRAGAAKHADLRPPDGAATGGAAAASGHATRARGTNCRRCVGPTVVHRRLEPAASCRCLLVRPAMEHECQRTVCSRRGARISLERARRSCLGFG